MRHARSGLRLESQLEKMLKPSPILSVAYSLLFCTLATASARAQQLGALPLAAVSQDSTTWLTPRTPSSQDPSQTQTTSDPKTDPPQTDSTIDSPKPKVDADAELTGVQTKRILFIIPNFRSVNASTYLPPQSFKEKLWLATQESFDYSAFIYEGIVAGIAMAGKSEPSFGQGASGYGIYYAHTFADGTIENYMVQAFVPAITKEDSRYYTLGHGSIFKRSGYALSRILITRTDSGKQSFNISEIAGAGAAAAISNVYYPPGNTWVKTYQRWGSQVLQDAIDFEFKEFWPDVNRRLFHNKY
jgi:hypothetical protein